ncbi:hypothetical protein FQZ97_883850 [compost metagenome]
MRGRKRQARVGAHGGKHIRPGLAEDHRHRRAGREPGHEHAPGIHRRVGGVIAHDLAHHGGDEGGLAALAHLVLRAKPVPAARRVGAGRLLGVELQKTMLIGQAVHLRAGGKVVGRLCAAVQHHDHWQGFGLGLRGLRRQVQLVGTGAGCGAEAARKELALDRLGGFGGCGPLAGRSAGGRRLGFCRTRHLARHHLDGVAVTGRVLNRCCAGRFGCATQPGR